MTESQARIAAAYSPELLEKAGHRLATLLADHFRKLEADQGSVLNWHAPQENVTEALRWMNQPPIPPHDLDRLADRLAECVEETLARGINLHHRRYVGHQVPASVPLAGWFDAVASTTNQVMAIYEMGPWASAVERAVLNQVGQRIGLADGQFSGLITSGASLANLTGLVAARNVSLDGVWQAGLSGRRQPVLVTHAEAHYSITRAAGVMGLGTDHLVKAPIDERRAIDPQRLDDLLSRLRAEGTPIVAVAAAACATPIGAFDPLDAIADVCQRHQVWLHVDAAHGGAACMSRRYRHLVQGIERADSVVCDAHKMFFMPALCALLFFRDARHVYRAFHQQAPYLFDPSVEEMAEYDSGKRTLECTKRAAALGLWGIWSMFGPSLFEEMVDTTFDLGKQFHSMLNEAKDFEALYPPECNIVVFRYRPLDTTMNARELDEFQLQLRRRVIESGDSYLVSNRLDGQNVLRTTIINPRTRTEDLAQLMDHLRFHARNA